MQGSRKRTGKAPAPGALPPLTLGADVLGDYGLSSYREWLVTNGIGGYASASLAGSNTRRYHGVLVAALPAPTERKVVLSRLEETVAIGGASYDLSASQYPGSIYPRGFQLLERFEVYPAPTFVFRVKPGVAVEKRVWMDYGRNTTFVRYALTESPEPVQLTLTPLVCWKDYHAEMHPWQGFPAGVDARDSEARITLVHGVPVLRLMAPGAAWSPADYWYYNIEHAREMDRGLDWREDLRCPGSFSLTLRPGESVTFTATVETDQPDPEQAWARWTARQADLLERAGLRDDFGKALVLAADQFIVPGDGDLRSTVIAGYPWFTDWGRDTMIALPGLCLETGRAELARGILASFASFVSEGMLPNRFPDQGDAPEYNTVDATLWFFEAVRAYVAAVGPEASHGFVRELWPTLQDIVQWHLSGTRYGIRVDEDGLVRAGVPGVQLTWMDAKVGDWVVTPRVGKPVEINALWYNALRIMEGLAEALGEEPAPYRDRADAVRARFRQLFVRFDGLGLYDVLTDEGPDAAIRPNQIFAVGLHHSPLDAVEQRAVVEVVERELLTPLGLRTLAPGDPQYRGRYGGSPWMRDGAYHQGTVWAWLIGAFVDAHLRVYGDHARARAFVEPFRAHLLDAGMGSISEVFDGDAPYDPGGCTAQAWSVSEVLRAWRRSQG